MKTCLAIAFITIAIFPSSFGKNHTVGGSTWSIPPREDFYLNWSNRQTFLVGDFIVFEFDSGLHNVMQVARQEYLSCTSINPFRVFSSSPATVPLIEKGIFYFICGIGNYCSLGQKLSITVQSPSPVQSPAPEKSSSTITNAHRQQNETSTTEGLVEKDSPLPESDETSPLPRTVAVPSVAFSSFNFVFALGSLFLACTFLSQV